MVKNMMKILVATAFAIWMTGCSGAALEISQTTNKDYKLEKLFEAEGCVVYRFFDGNAVYFTTCSGRTQSEHAVSNGKITYNVMDQTISETK